MNDYFRLDAWPKPEEEVILTTRRGDNGGIQHHVQFIQADGDGLTVRWRIRREWQYAYFPWSDVASILWTRPDPEQP